MTDQPAQSPAQIATANVKQKSSGFSPIWIIPIIAALIGGWMVFKSALDENTLIEVSFKDASGISAGKTVVKFRDVEIGKVKAVNFSKDLATIILTLEFKDVPADRFNEKTRFWVVRPRVGLGGVSGLETLLSGAYIEIDPSGIEGGKPVAKFIGLEQPELHQLGNPGTSYRLKTDSLGSLSRQSPVKFRDLEVGLVTRYELARDNTGIDIDIFIRAPYDKLVKSDTRFWDISGLKVEAGAAGIKLNMESVATLISGGIAFSASESTTGTQARAGSVFALYKTEKGDTADEAVAKIAFNVPLKLYFEQGVDGLDAGAPVKYKGLRVGTVSRVSAEYNEARDILRTFAIIHIEPDRLPKGAAPSDDRTDRTDAERTKEIQGYFESIAARGVRAQLKTGNLLTGKALVAFDTFADDKPQAVKYVAGMAVFPTVPGSLGDIMTKIDGAVTKIDGILAKLDSIPILEIGNDLAQTMDNINAIPITEIGNDLAQTMDNINAIPITEIGNDLAQTMDDINAIPITEIGNNLAQTSAKLEGLPYGQIGRNLDDALANLDALLESLNAAKGGVIGVQTRQALDEITKAANALRGMAEYLERHPEALLKGKKGP